MTTPDELVAFRRAVEERLMVGFPDDVDFVFIARIRSAGPSHTIWTTNMEAAEARAVAAGWGLTL